MPPLYSNSYTLNGTIYNSCHLQCQFLDQLGVWMPPHRPQYQFQCHKIAPGYESRNLSGRFQSRNLPFITQPPVCHATSPPPRPPLYSPQLSSAQLSSALLSDQCPALCSALYSGHPPSPSLTSVQNIILIRSGYDVMWCGVLLYPTLAPSTSINQNPNTRPPASIIIISTGSDSKQIQTQHIVFV